MIVSDLISERIIQILGKVLLHSIWELGIAAMLLLAFYFSVSKPQED